MSPSPISSVPNDFALEETQQSICPHQWPLYPQQKMDATTELEAQVSIEGLIRSLKSKGLIDMHGSAALQGQRAMAPWGANAS